MNKGLIIGIAVAILAIGGGVAFVLTSGSNEQNPYTVGQAEQTTTDKDFSPLPTSDLAFEAKAIGSASTGDFTATIKFDGQGNASYSGESRGETFEAYIADGTFIICSVGTCYKLPTAGGEVPIKEDQYSFNQEDFDQFKDNATYQGQEACPAGMCDVWLVDHPEQEGTTKVYLDSNRRVSQLKTETEDGSFDITYDYKDVTINLPSNVQEFPKTP